MKKKKLNFKYDIEYDLFVLLSLCNLLDSEDNLNRLIVDSVCHVAKDYFKIKEEC